MVQEELSAMEQGARVAMVQRNQGFQVAVRELRRFRLVLVKPFFSRQLVLKLN